MSDRTCVEGELAALEGAEEETPVARRDFLQDICRILLPKKFYVNDGVKKWRRVLTHPCNARSNQLMHKGVEPGRCHEFEAPDLLHHHDTIAVDALKNTDTWCG